MTKRAAVYVRISSDRPNEVSTDVQERTCRKWARDHGFAVADVYRDIGISAFKQNVARPDFDRMMTDVENGGVDVVVAYKLDRVSRSVIRPSPWFHLAVLLAFLGLEGVTAWARSATPAILGRYSPSWFAYQLVNLAILALLIASKRREGVRWVAYGLVIASTFVAASNDSVGAMPGVEAVLPLVRGLAALAIVAGEFDRFRGSSRSIRGPVLALGSTVVALSLLDLALWTGM